MGESDKNKKVDRQIDRYFFDNNYGKLNNIGVLINLV